MNTGVAFAGSLAPSTFLSAGPASTPSTWLIVVARRLVAWNAAGGQLTWKAARRAASWNALRQEPPQ